jgi:hypothetical protein
MSNHQRQLPIIVPFEMPEFSGVAGEKVDAIFIFSNGMCYNQAKIKSGEIDQPNISYELVKVLRTHEAFKQPISPISTLLSRPVRIFRFPSRVQLRCTTNTRPCS